MKNEFIEHPAIMQMMGMKGILIGELILDYMSYKPADSESYYTHDEITATSFREKGDAETGGL